MKLVYWIIDNNLKCTSEGEGINKLCYSHTMEYYTAEKMNELKLYIGT